MGDRVVDCARLESVCTARYPGFESPPIRQFFFAAGRLARSVELVRFFSRGFVTRLAVSDVMSPRLSLLPRVFLPLLILAAAGCTKKYQSSATIQLSADGVDLSVLIQDFEN